MEAQQREIFTKYINVTTPSSWTSTSGKLKESSSAVTSTIERVTEGKTSAATKPVALVTTGIATESSTTSIHSATTDKATKSVTSFVGTTTPISLGNYTEAASTVLYSTIDSKTTALTSKETTTATSIDTSTMPSTGTSSIAKPWTSVVGGTEDTVKSKEETTLSTTVTIKEESQTSIDSATTQRVTEDFKTQNTQSTKLTSDTHVRNMSTSASTVSTDVTKVTVATSVEESTSLLTAATSDTKMTIKALTAVSDVVTTSYIGPTVGSTAETNLTSTDFTTKNDSSSVNSSLDPNTLPATMTSEVSSLWSTVAEEAGKTKETVISTSTDAATILAGRSIGSTSSHLFMTKLTIPPLQATTPGTPGTQADAGLTTAPTSENNTVAATVQAFMTSTPESATESESTPATEKTVTSSITKGATEPISQHKEISFTVTTKDETTQSKRKEVISPNQFTEFTTFQEQPFRTDLETTLPTTTQSSKEHITKPFTITSESVPFKETTEKQVETTVNTITILSTEVLTGPTSMIPTSRDISEATGTMLVDLPTEYKGTSTLSTSFTTAQALAATTDLKTPVNTGTKQDSTISADVETNTPFTDKPFRATSPPATKELTGAPTSTTPVRVSNETFSGTIGTSKSTLTFTAETTNVTVGSQLAKTISIKATQETTPENQTTQEGMSRTKEFTMLYEPSQRTSETMIFTDSKPSNEVVTPSKEGSTTQGTTEKITVSIKATFSSHKEVTNSSATGEYKEPTTIKSTAADVSSTTAMKTIGMTVRDDILASPASHLGSAKERLINITKSTAVPGKTTTEKSIKDITKEITGTTIAESVKITKVEKGAATMEHTRTTTGALSYQMTPLTEANTTIITSTHTETVTASMSTESRGDTISVISTIAQPTITMPEKGTRGLDVSILTANFTMGITTEATTGMISKGEPETTLKIHPDKITTILPRSTTVTTYKTSILTSKEAHIAGTTTARLTAGSETIIPTTIKVKSSESTATESVKSSKPELVPTAGNTTTVLATVSPKSALSSNTTIEEQTTEFSKALKTTEYMTTEPKTQTTFKNTTTAMAAGTVTSAPTTKTTKMLQTFESISTAKATDIKSTEITIATTTTPETSTSTSTTSGTKGGQTVESITKAVMSKATTLKTPITPETTTLEATTNTTTISHTPESNTASKIAETLPTTSIMPFTTDKTTSSLAPDTASTPPTISTTKVASSTEYITAVKTTKILSVKSKPSPTTGTSMSAPITNTTLEAHPTEIFTTEIYKSTTTEPKGPFSSEITTIQLSTDTVTPAPPINTTLPIYTAESIITSKSTTESKQAMTTKVLEAFTTPTAVVRSTIPTSSSTRELSTTTTATFVADIPISTENTISAKQATTLKALVKMTTSVLAGSSKIPSVQQTEPAVKKGNFSETKMAMHTTDSTADFAHTRQTTSGVPTTISTTVAQTSPLTKVTAESITEVTKVFLPSSSFQVTKKVFPTETKTAIMEKTSTTTQTTTTKSIPRSTLELIKGLTMQPEKNVSLHSTTDAKGTIALVGEVSTKKVDSMSVTGKTTVGASKTTNASIVTISISKATVPGIGAAKDITTGSTTNITNQTAGKASTFVIQKGEATSPEDTTSKPLITSSSHIGLIISNKTTERAVNATVSTTTIRRHVNITESSTTITKTTRGLVTSSLIPNTTKPGTISINATAQVNGTTAYHIGNITIVLIAVNTSLPTNITMPPVASEYEDLASWGIILVCLGVIAGTVLLLILCCMFLAARRKGKYELPVYHVHNI